MSVPVLPILGICGPSGSGKTTLIEQLLPRLRDRGLKVAVVKHATSRVEVDKPGKDSDRIFHAGADVLLHGPDQSLLRCHGPGTENLPAELESLATAYDLVLVEGHKTLSLPKLWLLNKEGQPAPEHRTDALAALPWDDRRTETALATVEGFLARQWASAPLLGCVLIGGRSTRMGTPKHLLRREGKTWLERTVKLLQPFTEQTVIAGQGELPAGLERCIRLADAPGVRGPLAGLLSALRWSPWACWLVAACDLPQLSAPALQWLLAQRRPGAWAVVPACPDPDDLQPLLACYDFRCRGLMEDLAVAGDFRVQSLGRCDKALNPTVPPELAPAWTNVNTPPELGTLA